MENKKYTFSEVTKEESEAFMSDFNDLCKKHSVVASLVPQYRPVEGSPSFETTVMLLIQHATEVVEVEKVEGAVPSTNSEVNPILSDEPTKEN